MGNKGATSAQTSKGLKTQQPLPRNISSLYGPKPTASENNLSDQSGFSSVSSVSTNIRGNKLDDDGDDDKINLRLSRVHRCVTSIIYEKQMDNYFGYFYLKIKQRRSDGFQNHASEESLASAIRNITKFIDTFSSVNVGTCLLESSNLSAFLHENTLELSKKQSLIQELLLDQDQEDKSKQIISEEKHLEAGNQSDSKCDDNQIKQEDKDKEIDNDSSEQKNSKEVQAHQLSDQEPQDISTRPTACFRNQEQMSFAPAKQQQIRETFGGAGGIQVPALEDKESQVKEDEEDEEFVPCRQTANFGSFERQNQRKQQEKLKAIERLNNPINQRQIIEDDNEDESREDVTANYCRDVEGAYNYNNQNGQYYYNDGNTYEEEEDEEYSEPIYLKIDLSAQTKKKRDNITGSKDMNQNGQSIDSQKAFDETIQKSLQEDENLLEDTENSEQEFQQHESEIQKSTEQELDKQQIQKQQENQPQIENQKQQKNTMDQQKLQNIKDTSEIHKIDKVDISKFSPKNSKSPVGALRKGQQKNDEVQVKQVFLQNTMKGIKRSVTPNVKNSNTNSTIHINSKSKSPLRKANESDHEDIKKEQVKERKVIMKSNSFSIIKTIKTKPNELEKKENKKDIVNMNQGYQKDKNILTKGQNQFDIKQGQQNQRQVDDKKPSFRETVDALDDQMDELLNQIYGDLSNVKAKIQKDTKLSPCPSKNILDTGKPANL